MPKFNNFVSKRFFRRDRALKLKRAAVSITFDDIPHSAATTAAEILDKHSAHGSFYIAPSLIGSSSGEMAPYATLAEIQSLHDRGHHIAAHSYNHVSVTDLSPEQISSEVEQCDEALKAALSQSNIPDFSFPFGEMSGRTKRDLSRRYRSLRSIFPGLNSDPVDLAALKAVSLYSASQTEATIKGWIDRAIQENAWLIFYTHDVQDSPSPWGTTPALFNYAIETAAAADVDLLSVEEVLERADQAPQSI